MYSPYLGLLERELVVGLRRFDFTLGLETDPLADLLDEPETFLVPIVSLAYFLPIALDSCTPLPLWAAISSLLLLALALISLIWLAPKLDNAFCDSL